ncbi:hypothetical protein BZA05DRAFT_247283 [Tricharina praecox]|uniref:uncharacterized protein n=1 Tax=Tricharina praecox TaxID=43433 RepID=UPI00221E8ECF|nr:uncharacterized protein BZA05DRAFT_247283 [Tricharina praecox]KAI5854669.1 hypothetical protein BZA05DRAFT_247283 [Tricharina praecox]
MCPEVLLISVACVHTSFRCLFYFSFCVDFFLLTLCGFCDLFSLYILGFALYLCSSLTHIPCSNTSFLCFHYHSAFPSVSGEVWVLWVLWVWLFANFSRWIVYFSLPFFSVQRCHFGLWGFFARGWFCLCAWRYHFVRFCFVFLLISALITLTAYGVDPVGSGYYFLHATMGCCGEKMWGKDVCSIVGIGRWLWGCGWVGGGCGGWFVLIDVVAVVVVECIGDMDGGLGMGGLRQRVVVGYPLLHTGKRGDILPSDLREG